MAASQGGLKVETDCAPIIGPNVGEPARPDTSFAPSSPTPPPVPAFGNNDSNKVR